MSRYSSPRDDPRSIFFGGGSAASTPLIRSYAGSDLLQSATYSKQPPVPPAPAPTSSPPPSSSSSSSSSGTGTPGTPASSSSPVVRIIPIHYPAQPARLIGSSGGYGGRLPPKAAATPTTVDDAPELPLGGASQPTTAGPATKQPPNGGGSGQGILRHPASPSHHLAPAPASGTPSRVSFSARPVSTTGPKAKPGPAAAAAMAAAVPPNEPPGGCANGVHKGAAEPSGLLAGPVAAPAVQPSRQSPQPQQPPPLQPPPSAAANCRMQLALYGWRKKCLYALILILTIMIIVNMALTLWIMKVMEFSSNGMGQLKVVPGGIQLTGQALVLNTLRASSIQSKHGQPISLESSRNLSMNTRNAAGALENQLFLGHDRLEVLATHFRITDTHGTHLFAVDRDEVTVGAGSLRVEGEGGVIFRDSLQTPLVRADAGKDLRLESPTRSLEARATQEIFIQSRAGGIEATCLNDLKLHSVAGSIRLDASAIYMPNLKTVQGAGSGTTSALSSVGRGEYGGPATVGSGSGGSSKIYQLCACASGKLFLAAANSICAADDTAICR
ncbi:delta-sarcoglycan [Anopheles cruzii]|uniref:delta-sarcoglycan n=1 Tax=Anopheles cruzii TaxID=68878 RepID=UPI0022EC79AD|nr:delta-sarcoglycan [Anopheles cruzii]